MTLVAICRPRYPQQSPEIVDLTKADLRLKVNRVTNLIRMINLCSLIVPITTAIGVRTTAEFVPLRRWESLFAHVSHRLILSFFFAVAKARLSRYAGSISKKLFKVKSDMRSFRDSRAPTIF
jgi:hypothetical protein